MAKVQFLLPLLNSHKEKKFFSDYAGYEWILQSTGHTVHGIPEKAVEGKENVFTGSETNYKIHIVSYHKEMKLTEEQDYKW